MRPDGQTQVQDGGYVQELFGYVGKMFRELSDAWAPEGATKAAVVLPSTGPGFLVNIRGAQNLGSDYYPGSPQYFSELHCGDFHFTSASVDVAEVRVPKQADTTLQIHIIRTQGNASALAYQLFIPLALIEEEKAKVHEEWFAVDSPKGAPSGDLSRLYHASIAAARSPTVPKIKLELLFRSGPAESPLPPVEQQLRRELQERELVIQKQKEELQRLSQARIEISESTSRRIKPPYKVVEDDPYDVHVEYFFKHRPDLWQGNSCVRKRSRIYDINGREVELDWHYATSPDEQGFLVVIDGPLWQPFLPYMEGTEAGAEYCDADARQALHLVPRNEWVSFGFDAPTTGRLEAMRVAKQQAEIREQEAARIAARRGLPMA
eukprot:CAMPEP_0204316474 /NCGR_PEP_ID=MMETSP0469-20131031/5415_1 /ASSEMBLY_ACC=CAM_ASM_000384 /TAXON_ID=2969 /ORGANISM="Oxyrrhis marina" /LENGTH=377 /DNA_ID=CAMNT_0051297251 /DNA_START=19 /DNA_END=1152 /DNA_ORIENTATION=-